MLSVDKKMYFEEEPELLSQVTNFDLFIELVNSEGHNEEREFLINFLSILFPNYNIFFTP